MSSLPIPGSVVLVDLDGHAGGPHSAAHNDIILHPTPSRDVNDPLNWSKWRKQLHFAMLMTYCVSVGFCGCALNSVLVPISEQNGIKLGDLVAGTGYMFLLLGWGGLITQPFALTYGKRLTYMISNVLNVAMVIWLIYINNSGTWFANRLIMGLISAPIEMLVEVSIADIFYAHERGFYMGVYSMALFGGNFLAPVWAGFANDRWGYKWVFWICAIQMGLASIIMFFFMEETNYNRGTTEITEHDVVATPDSEQEAGGSDKKSEAVVSHNVVGLHTERQLVGTPHTYLQRLSLWHGMFNSVSTMWAQAYRPILFLRYPVVFWSGFLYGSSLIWYNVLNATASLIFTDVYNFKASAVGLTYLGPTIGACLATVWGGWAADKWLVREARRKNGLREPEDRLWLLVLNAIVLPVGLILWGVGAAKQIHWIGLVIGGSMVAFTSANGCTIALNYVLDSYKDLGGEVILSVILVRNTMSFGIGYAITPWLNMGYQNTFITAALVGMAVYASFLPVVYYGKRWRTASAKSYWQYVKTSVVSH
ncbi:hypothetical protein VHUM_04086 [Vanrija humicola]|uniref:Major facilitator superfamily (MFS) profile domain-containing protein n=1 Tax=Vanrija humicola TaxID=5417 RepID=A0A7D8YUR6_VANHU|nr:hypothetical protein VHUM_04086 [Vanrija humicola]